MYNQEKKIVNRCWWVNMKNPLYVEYHDCEWSIPEHSDKKLFAMLLLECFQAGLSWECVLNKRDAFRQAFDNFDVEKISQYDDAKCEKLLSAPIIRNKLKIKAFCIMEVCGGGAYLWLYPEHPDSGFPIYATGTTSHKRNLRRR